MTRTDIYGGPLPLKAVAADPAPTLQWALVKPYIRVHMAWSNSTDTLCGFPAAEDDRRDMIGPGYMRCLDCERAARTI